jgi:hypothetical protein
MLWPDLKDHAHHTENTLIALANYHAKLYSVRSPRRSTNPRAFGREMDHPNPPCVAERQSSPGSTSTEYSRGFKKRML